MFTNCGGLDLYHRLIPSLTLITHDKLTIHFSFVIRKRGKGLSYI
jgi:hypothetical protein